jgi:alcohol dehydrogenase YqhD (iron-dependent ADH family)
MQSSIYDKVMAGLSGHEFIEFSGVEPNPLYETCMKAVEIAKKNKTGFLRANVYPLRCQMEYQEYLTGRCCLP